MCLEQSKTIELKKKLFKQFFYINFFILHLYNFVVNYMNMVLHVWNAP